MARGHAVWVIVSGGTPTAFRARQRDDLLPTLYQLQRKHPDTVLRWFDHGQLWESPDAARQAVRDRRQKPSGRARDWRPGGEHRDPKARFELTRDQKRARFKKRLLRDRSRPDTKGPRTTRTGPADAKGAAPYQRPKRFNRKPALGQGGRSAPKRNWRRSSKPRRKP